VVAFHVQQRHHTIGQKTEKGGIGRVDAVSEARRQHQHVCIDMRRNTRRESERREHGLISARLRVHSAVCCLRV